MPWTVPGHIWAVDGHIPSTVSRMQCTPHSWGFPFYDQTFNLVFPSYARLSGPSVLYDVVVTLISQHPPSSRYYELYWSISSFNSFQFLQHLNVPSLMCGLNVVRIFSVTFLVHMSLSLSSDLTNCTSKCPWLHKSLIKCARIEICFVRCPTCWFFTRYIAPVLSSYIIAGLMHVIISSNNCWVNLTACAAVAIATYSASELDNRRWKSPRSHFVCRPCL